MLPVCPLRKGLPARLAPGVSTRGCWSGGHGDCLCLRSGLGTWALGVGRPVGRKGDPGCHILARRLSLSLEAHCVNSFN